MHASLVSWLEAAIRRSDQEARAHVEAEQQALADQAAAAQAQVQARAEQKQRHKPMAGMKTNTQATGRTRETLHHVQSPAESVDHQPRAVRPAPAVDSPPPMPAVAATPAFVPTPAAGTSTKPRDASQPRGRRTFPNLSAQPTLVADADRPLPAFESDSAIVTPRPLEPPRAYPAGTSDTATADNEDDMAGLFGPPKKVDKSKLLSPYLQSDVSLQKNRPKARATSSASTSGSKRESSTRRSPPSRSPVAAARPAGPTAASLSFSLDDILAQTRLGLVQATDEETTHVAEAFAAAKLSRSSATRSASSTRSAPSGVPAVAHATTAASAAKRRPVASAMSSSPASGKQWNAAYGNTSSRLFSGSLVDPSVVANDVSPATSTTPAAARRRTANASPSAHSSTTASHLRRRSMDRSAEDTGVPHSSSAAPSGYTVHHADPSAVSGSAYSSTANPRVPRSTALGQSIPYDVLMQHSAFSGAHRQLPPPPPLPPAVPAPTDAVIAVAVAHALRFPPAFASMLQHCAVVSAAAAALEQRRTTAWDQREAQWTDMENGFTAAAETQQAMAHSNGSADDDGEDIDLVEDQAESHRAHIADIMAGAPVLDKSCVPSVSPAPYASLYPWLPDAQRTPFAYPFTRTNLATVSARLLTSSKQRAQANRRSTAGLEPSDADVRASATADLLSFERQKADLLAQQLDSALEESTAAEIAPLLAPTSAADPESLPTRTLLALLKLTYAVLHAGGRSGPRDRHHQPRKAMPTFLAVAPVEDGDLPSQAGARHWNAAEEAAAREEAEQPDREDDLDVSREEMRAIEDEQQPEED